MSNNDPDRRALSINGSKHEFLMTSDRAGSIKGFSQSRKLTKIEATL